MERYKEYKDRGVKWLGEIPSHWEVLKSKFLWRETFENSISGKEDLLSVSQYTGVTKSMADSRSESLEGYKIVHKDELVINIMLAWLGGLGVSDFEGVVSPAYCTYKLIRNENPKFLHYLYKTPMYLAEFARHSTGVVPSRWRMYTDDFGQVLSLLPPLSEQDSIVRYLDSATSEIDKAIAMQQKMIDLLNERKQIIIQNAVTKGLDENVEMKESGVEWIGRIPKHWEVVPLKYTGAFGNGLTYSPIEIVDDGVLVIRSSNIQNSKLVFDDNVFVEIIPQNLMVKKGDIIICSRNGSADLVGKCAIVEENINATFGAFMMRYTPNINPKYAFFLFQTAIRSYKGYFSTSTINQLTKTIIGEMKVPVAGISEQQQIAAYLDVEMQRFDSAITNCQRQITLLQERKQIIINEVVTGKVRVS